MYCKNCGVRIVPTEAKYCWNCGFFLNSASVQNPTPTNPAGPMLESCQIVVMDGSLNMGFFQANAKGPDREYVAGKSAEFSMLSHDAFWLDQSGAHKAHEQLLTQLASDGWQKLGQAGPEWWATTFRRALKL